MSVLDLVRADLRDFTLYTPADGDDRAVRLHANELPWRSRDDTTERGLNRYPHPRDRALQARLADLYGVAGATVLPTRGSDDGIDLLIRTFCQAGHDRIMTTVPGFSMYANLARLQGCASDTIVLNDAAGFALDVEALLDAVTRDTKLVFLCSPNNPSGNLVELGDIDRLCSELAGSAVLVLDEAYAEFAAAPSAATLLAQHDNLVVLRTLSKAYGLAGARVGAILARAPVVATLNRLLTPYALPTQSVEAALAAISDTMLAQRREQWASIVRERERLGAALATLPNVHRVWPSHANFLLTRMRDAQATVEGCRARGYLVRCLRLARSEAVRVTVGTREQNDGLLRVLGSLQ